MFVKKLSISILALYGKIYKSLRKGGLIFYTIKVKLSIDKFYFCKKSGKLTGEKSRSFKKGDSKNAVSVKIYYRRITGDTGKYK